MRNSIYAFIRLLILTAFLGVQGWHMQGVFAQCSTSLDFEVDSSNCNFLKINLKDTANFSSVDLYKCTDVNDVSACGPSEIIPFYPSRPYSIDLTNSGSGYYRILVFFKDSCKLWSEPFFFPVLDIPAQPTITASPTPAALTCTNTSITLTAVNTSNWPISWYKDTVLIPNQTSSTITVSTAGSYKVRVTNSRCIAESMAVPITDNRVQRTLSINPATLCEGTETTLSVTLSPAVSISSYSWSTGSTVPSPRITPELNKPVSVTVTVTDNLGCSYTATRNITARPRLSFADSSLVIEHGKSTTINFSLNPATSSLRWLLPADSINITRAKLNTQLDGRRVTLSPQLENVNQLGGIRYRLIPSNGGCAGDTSLLTIKVRPKSMDLYIPEVFSPNGDGVNETWDILFPDNKTSDNFRIKVFNRSGGLVYDNASMGWPWDASNCPDGVYFYTIESKDGLSLLPPQKGAITIIGRNRK